MTYREGAILPLTHSLTPPLLRFVTAGYAVQASFKFSSKSIGFPRAKHHIGFIFSCENLADMVKYLSAGNANHRTFYIKSESIYAMRVGKLTRLKLVVAKCFVQLQTRFSSRQDGLITC